MVWKPVGGYDMVDIGFGFYMVKFDVAEDRDKVISDGPWMLFDHYHAVCPWVPDSSRLMLKSIELWCGSDFHVFEWNTMMIISFLQWLRL